MKKLNFKKMVNGRNTVLALFVLASVFLFGHLAHAAFGEWAGNVVGGIIALFIRAIASILILLVDVLMAVASYSHFIDAPAVAKGWIVVRDLCNMFFVVILLIIAFATILGQEEYGAKKMLPKLVYAAVLINFSKLICGLMIDVSNVVMLTFVNAFSAIGASNLLDMLGISDITRISAGSNDDAVTFGTIVSAYIFGLIYVIIATIVVAAMLAMLVVRVVMIWILVVLSPLAFFLQAVPGKGQEYAGKWWGKWSKNLLVGPVIAFFLWLSFASLQTTNPITSDTSSSELAANNTDMTDSSGIGSKAGTPAAMAKFVIAIGMLLGGMSIAQEVGGEAAGVMGKVFGKGSGMAKTAAGAIGGFAVARGKDLGNAAGRGARNVALGAVGNMGKKDPITGKRSSAVGNFALAWRDDLQATRRKEKDAQKEKFLKSIGIKEKSAEKAQVVYDNVKNNKVVSDINGRVKFTASNKKYDAAKNRVEAYKNSGFKASDEAVLTGLRARVAADKSYTRDKWSASELTASDRMKKDVKDNKLITKRDDNPAFRPTGKALSNMTEKKKRTEKTIEVMANDPEYWTNVNKAYDNKGITERQKLEFDAMNTAEPGSKAHTALQNLVNQVGGVGGVTQLTNDQAHDQAKLLAAWMSDTKNSPKNLAQLDTALRNSTAVGPKTTDTAALSGKVLRNYAEFDKGKMILNEGRGKLEYDTFAQNSAKKPNERDGAKDYMGVSFAKLNTKAREMGVDYNLEPGAAVNLQGDEVKKVSALMSGVIDDEIKALETSINQAASSNPDIKANQDKIKNLQKEFDTIPQPTITQRADYNKKMDSAKADLGKQMSGLSGTKELEQLRTAKSRFDNAAMGRGANDLSKLSLNNSDVMYKGETDSEKRAAKYNKIQHEQIHNAGAQDEELTDESANALQESKLIGRIPGTKDRYDTEIGKMISQMETLKVDKNEIREAIAQKINGWQVPNAQKVLETEQGTRETVTESTDNATAKPELVKKEPVAQAANNEEQFEALNKNMEVLSKSMDKLATNLNKKIGSGTGGSKSMSISDANFFRTMFGSLNKSIGKIAVNREVTPLSAMAISEESETK